MGLLKGMNAVTQLLDLEEFEAVELEEDRARRVRRIVVVPRVSVGVCPKCGKPTDRRHQTRERTVRDLPLGAYATELVVRQPQYQCSRCGVLFTPRSAALSESAHATERFLARLAELARFGDLKNAAAFLGVAEKTLERWHYDYLERQVAARKGEPVRSLGIDELSRKKSAGDTAAC